MNPYRIIQTEIDLNRKINFLNPTLLATPTEQVLKK